MPSMKQLFKAIDANRDAGRHHTVASYNPKVQAGVMRQSPAKSTRAPSVFGRTTTARQTVSV